VAATYAGYRARVRRRFVPHLWRGGRRQPETT
jgi:hypothetical protein